MVDVVLGLGGNLGDPVAAFRAALAGIGARGRVAAVSRVWRTRPVGPDQPDFFNAAAVITWPTAPLDLFKECRRLESKAGRDRANEERWGPRVLDLDLLLGEGFLCFGPDLEVPHPRFHERRFALEPAAEVAPEWTHPLLGRSVAELAAKARGLDPDAVLEVSDFDPGFVVR